MRDGVLLVADRLYCPDKPRAPVVFMRSPYGRSALFGIIAGLLVERGFQVLLQSVRGTMDSGGEFDPMRQERADGADTIRWLREQPWCGAQVFGFGFSYLGNAQWALAAEEPEGVDAFGLAMTLSNFRDETLSFGGFTQAGALGWTQLMQGLVDWQPGQKMQRPDPRQLEGVHDHLPVGTLDEAALGRVVTWWRDWTGHDDPADPWWDAIDHSAVPASLKQPIVMVGGWQDIFLPFQMEDFRARQAAGQPTWLTIGPWAHASPAGMIAGLRESLALFRALRDHARPFAQRNRVRVQLQGTRRWLEFPAWPPPAARDTALYLQAGGRLSPARPDADGGHTAYTYDPADPTPAVHGPAINAGAKKRPLRQLVERDDTLLFTAEPFLRDTDVVGDVAVELAVSSDTPDTDVFVALCDVDGRGRAAHVCDGYLRLRPGVAEPDAQGIRRVTVNCWPTAYRFRRGHSVGLVVASGAHPRYARNLGTGEPLATAVAMQPARQQVWHREDRVSSLRLAVLEVG